MKCNMKHMLLFKKFFHDGNAACLQGFTKEEHLIALCEVRFGKLDKDTKEWLKKLNEKDGLEVGMTVNRCSGGRKKENVQEIIALYVDCDDQKISLDQLLSLPVPPHLIVETSPGNYHAYWLISGCDVDQFKSVQEALSAKIGTKDAVSDPGRAMRMAGSINWKRKRPFLTAIVHIDDNARPIPLANFLRRMEIHLDKTPRPKKKTVNSNLQDEMHSRISPALHSRIERALDGLPADDRWVWYRVGAAIHSVDSSESGYKRWTRWSQTSSKFNEKDQRVTWDAFKPGRGINVETLFYLANHIKSSTKVVLDEMSLAEMYARTMRRTLRYDRESREWVWFDGVVWKADAQAPLRMALQFIGELSNGEKGEYGDAVKRFRTAAAMKAIVNQAELLEIMHISLQSFDRNPNLLAAKNGVIDLRTGEFRRAVPGDYLRRKLNVEYAESAECPLWKKFMRDICCSNNQLYRFLKRALGYTLYGEANLQVFFIAIGSGGNGKGTLMRTIQKILGDYAQSIAPNLLSTAYSGNANGPSPALAKLNGARMVICTELPNRGRLDEAFIKQYAGGDELTARPTYGEVFSFTPEGKLWLSANDPPEIRAGDEAMWRRLIPIPFDAKFDGRKRDDELEKKFAAEYSGILNWLLQGAKEYAESGLGSCPAVDALKLKMKKEADSVLAWLDERCEVESDAATPSSAAYGDYSDFMKRLQRKALAMPAFRASLIDKGYPANRKNVGNFFDGFRLRHS